jgi:glycosyltransferase involved in cell wall biosynthesis
VTPTILIPTWNRPVLLLRAVRSALAALPDGGEVLVVDDRSDPPASNAVATLGDPRVRVVVNTGARGAAGARNHGIGAARGSVIFFLDDDDEMLPFYCAHILSTVLPAHPETDFGFSAWLSVSEADPRGRLMGDGLPDGPVAEDAPMRARAVGFGLGFWAKRQVLLDMGPIDEALPVHEDTEFMCRLIGAGRRAWFTARPAVRIHRHATDADAAHVTSRTTDLKRAEAMASIVARHPQFAGYLGESHVRHLVRAGHADVARGFVRGLADPSLRRRLNRIIRWKSLGYALTGRHRS